MITEYQESTVAFGVDGRLSGIVTRPITAEANRSGIWCLMPNSGVVPRCGVSRLHVRLARALAAVGVSSLRFDLSGLGDSERSRNGEDPMEMAQRDLAAATAFVRETMGSRGECWVGLCSAAYDAIRFASNCSSVLGIVAIDLISEYRNKKHVVTHYLKRMGSAESWIQTARSPLRSFGILANRLAMRAPQTDPESWLGVRPPLRRSELRISITRLSERNVGQLFVFSGGLSENYNYTGQFRDVFSEEAQSEHVTDVFLEEAGHNFDTWRDQERLCGIIVDWVRTRIAPPARPVLATH